MDLRLQSMLLGFRHLQEPYCNIIVRRQLKLLSFLMVKVTAEKCTIFWKINEFLKRAQMIPKLRRRSLRHFRSRAFLPPKLHDWFNTPGVSK